MSYYIIGNVLLWEEKKKNIDHFQKKKQKNPKTLFLLKSSTPTNLIEIRQYAGPLKRTMLVYV